MFFVRDFVSGVTLFYFVPFLFSIYSLENIFIEFNLTFLSIIFVSILILFNLLMSAFFEHTSKFIVFIHQLITFYLRYFLYIESTGRVICFIEQSLFNVTEVLLILNGNTLFFYMFLLYSSCVTFCLFCGVSERFFISVKSRFEFSIILCIVYLRGLFLFHLNTLIDILLTLEIITLSFYILIAFERHNRFSTYAGVQYFILGSIPSAILLLSFGLFYIQGGSIILQDLDLLFNVWSNIATVNIDLFSFFMDRVQCTSDSDTKSEEGSVLVEKVFYATYFILDQDRILFNFNARSLVAQRGVFFLFSNFFFKLTVAPFHIWAPSVYEKGPVASVTYLTIYSKLLIFFLRFKFRHSFLYRYRYVLIYNLIFIGLFTLFIGMMNAFIEKIIKRFFIYSSIGHVGFIVIGFAINTIDGTVAAFHYLAVYILSSFIIWFFVIGLYKNSTHLVHILRIKKTEPIVTLIFGLLVFSRSGIPPLGGFFIKLDILTSMIDASHFFIVYILFVFTVLGFFYYLRLIKIIFFDIVSLNKDEATIQFNRNYIYEMISNNSRLWIISFLILILSLYSILVQKSILYLIFDIVNSI